ncbi:MAG: [FeFe] hydrogenase H-cluster radical SAM maturase HydE [Solidesulfovibrio sp.]|uniref:[FeFe] hydrogenase H-cluster radical SAM maturase HydE n=1 Tax=Solidesulfovibrio sp. TaxID=2910990 RepID=UPI003158A9E5
MEPAWNLPDILRLLATRPGEARQALYDRADAVRREYMGDEVFLRGIIEFSNICRNDCLYCGIRASNDRVARYRLGEAEILELARRMPEHGQTTVVLQSGEAPSREGDAALARLIARIKAETPLAVTVSVGNRPREVYAAWRDSGMDRYLLRFETSDPALFARLHPDCGLAERLHCLEDLRSLGVQLGSGFMIGLPGERRETLAENILLCRGLELDMIGIGPFLAHPDTPLGGARNAYALDPDMHFLALAVTRLVNPDAHIPATTAYDALFPGSGRNLALTRGANVFMPSATPGQRRRDYLLYPDKPCVDETGDMCARCVMGRLAALNRRVGIGPGHGRRSPNVTSNPKEFQS